MSFQPDLFLTGIIVFYLFIGQFSRLNYNIFYKQFIKKLMEEATFMNNTKSNFGKWGWAMIIYCGISYYMAAVLSTDT